MTLRMEVTSADSGEATNYEPYLVKVHPAADILSVPEKSEVNLSAATSLLHHDPFERESTAYSKGDNSFSTDKGISDVEGSHKVESTLDCKIGSNKSVQECNDNVNLTQSKDGTCLPTDEISNPTNEICEKSNDEISSSNSSNLNAVAENENDITMENDDKNDNKTKIESGINGNNIVTLGIGGKATLGVSGEATLGIGGKAKLGVGGKSDEMIDKSKDCDVSDSTMNCEDIDNKNSKDSVEMEKNQMDGKSGVSENIVSAVCNGTSPSGNAAEITENPSSDIEARKEIENKHNLDAGNVLQNQVVSPVNDMEKNYSQFQNTKSDSALCEEENEKLTGVGDNTKMKVEQQESDTCLLEKDKTKGEQSEKDNLNTEKVESESLAKEKSDSTNEKKPIQESKCLLEEETESKETNEEKLNDENTTDMTKSQKEEISASDKNDNLGNGSEKCQSSVVTRKDGNNVNNQEEGEYLNDIKDSSNDVKTTNSKCPLDQDNGQKGNVETSVKLGSDLPHISVTYSLPEKESCQSNTENKLVCNIEKGVNDKEKLDSQMGGQKIENCENAATNETSIDKTSNVGYENKQDELKNEMVIDSEIRANDIKNDVVSSDVGKDVLAENSVKESKNMSENKCDHDTNSIPTEIKIKKKRGRKPKSVTNSAEIALDLSTTKGGDYSMGNNIGKMETVQTEDLNHLSVDIANDQSKSSIQSVSPTRSGRKSYKKLNKEFLYDYESSENDVKESSYKKKSDSNAQKKNISPELENPDVDSDVLKGGNSSSTPCENLNQSSPSKVVNPNLPIEKVPRACTPRGSAILYKCQDCKFESSLRTNFKEHLCIHLGYKPICCTSCDFRTCHKNNIYSHCTNMHGDRNVYKIVREMEHEQFLVARVKDCRKFVSKKYITHTKNLKKRVSATKIKTSSYKKIDCQPATDDMVKCPYCMFHAHSNSSIKKHVVWKHKIVTYQCQQCEFSSLLKTEVALHISNKHGGGTFSPVKSLKPRTEVMEGEDEGLKDLEGKLGPKNLDTSLGPYWNQTNSARKRLLKSGTVRMENFKKKSSMKGKFSQFPRKPKRVEKCPVCGFESIAVLGIRRHMFFRHKLCSWVCTGCSATFPHRDEAVCHMQMYHSGQHVKISRTLPGAPSRVTNAHGKKILSSLDTEVKIARKMKKRSNLGLHTDLNSTSSPQNNVEKSDVDSELKTEFRKSIPDENLKEEQRDKNTETSNSDINMKSEIEHSNFLLSDIPAASDTMPSRGDISHQNSVTLPRKPGRPKLNKTDLNSKDDVQLQMTDSVQLVHKKRGRKRKAESLTGDGNDGSPSGNVKKLKKSLKSSNLIMTNDSSFDCITDISVENCNKTVDSLLVNSPSTGIPVPGKKRGPKKKTVSSSLCQSVDAIQFTGENENKVRTSDMKREENTVLNSFMCGAVNDTNINSGPKTPKSKIIMTVADVHHSDLKSDGEFTDSYSKNKNVYAEPTLESNCEYRIAEMSPSKQICGLNDERIDKFNESGSMFDIERKQKLKQKKMKKTFDFDSDHGSCIQSDSERASGDDNLIKIKKKRGRKKKIDQTGEVDENEIWSNWKSSSYVLHPKKIDKVQVAYSCPYCNYAAPLRHQLRLHCYGRHTDRPACLIEFKNKRKPGRPPGRPNNVKLSPKQINKSKASSPCKETNQNVNDNVVSEGAEMSPSLPPKTIVKKRFNNPLKPMVRQLNGCRVRVYDTFHSCVDIDDVDRYLDKFGVRTLNMDMLTPKQFSKFMSKFGGNLQGVDL